MNQVKKKGEVETKLETFVNNAFESIHGKMPDFKDIKEGDIVKTAD